MNSLDRLFMRSSRSSRMLFSASLEMELIGFCREFTYDVDNEMDLTKELVLQVRKVIGPFAAPKKVYIVSDLPKTRSGKVRWKRFEFYQYFIGLMRIKRLCAASCARSLQARATSLET